MVASLDEQPGNITVTPTGDVLISLNQFAQATLRVVKVKDNRIEPYASSGRGGINSVLGLQAEPNGGAVWLLDNGMRGSGKRQLIRVNPTETLQAFFGDDVSIASSFLSDLAIDPATEPSTPRTRPRAEK